jgi:ATP-dependent DNA helicase RecG
MSLFSMAANGSPSPLFETDDDRLSFVIRLPSHPLAMGEIAPTEQVTGEVQRLLLALAGEMSRQQLLDALGMAHRKHFRSFYMKPALEAGVVEMTLPHKPNSSNQRYRLTVLGRRWLMMHPGTGLG